MQTVTDFINRDFKQFSNYDNERNLPNIVDGLKTSQRKAVYTMIAKNFKNIKVSQFGNYISGFTHYVHGENNMCETVAKMAQDFTTSNNVNLFEPLGIFGTISDPKWSSVRYIFTEKSKWFDLVFDERDENIFKYKIEENEKVEPETLFPIIPLFLVNGVRGIGTGHACRIYPHLLKDVIRYIDHKINNSKKQPSLVPNYNGYMGEVSINNDQIIFSGKYEKVNSTTLHITALPPSFSAEKYREKLIKLLDDKIITDYSDNSNANGFSYIIKATRGFCNKPKEYIEKKLSLISTDKQNFTMWDNGSIIKYKDVYEAIDRFIELRLGYYEQRRLKMIELLNDKKFDLEQTILFINTWIDKQLGNENLKYVRETMLSVGIIKDNINKLLNISIKNLIHENINHLEIKLNKIIKEIEYYQKSTNKALYNEDLKKFNL